MTASLQAAVLVLRLVTTQGGSEEAAARAAESAEKAAVAAQKAAEAAEKAAQAAAKVIEGAAPVAAVEPAKPAAPKAEWTGSAALGFVALTGNAQSLTTNLSASANRTTERWIIGVKAQGAYSQSLDQDTNLTDVDALWGTFQVREDLRFTPMVSAFLLQGIDTDHVKSIEARPYGDAGVGLLWLHQLDGKLVKLRLHTDIAFRYGYEYRYQYYPVPLPLEGEAIVAPRFGVGFRYALNKDVIFTEDAEVLPTITGPSRVLANSTTKISARIAEPFAVSAGFIVRHDSRPPPDTRQTDTTLSLGIEASF